ncbi:MAG: T9SS type A sorting domain-containing protein [Salibacteraceae bacterium]
MVRFYFAYSFIVCLLILGLNGFSQNQVNLITYGGSGTDECNSLFVTEDEGFALAGASGSYSSNGVSDVYLLKFDLQYQLEWSRLIGGQGIEKGNRVIQTNDKGYAIAGFTNSYGAGGYDMYLIKLDSNGTLEWDRTYGGSNWDFATSVVQTPDNGFLVVGNTQSFGSGSEDMYVVKTDALGIATWSKTYGDSKQDLARDAMVMGNGNYLVVGEYTPDTADSSDIYVAELATNGDVLWSQTYGGSWNDGAYRVKPLFRDRIGLFGYTNVDTNNKESYMMALDTLGNVLWARLYEDPNGPPKRDDIGYDFWQIGDTGSYLDSMILIGITTESTYGNESDFFCFAADYNGGWWTPTSATYGGSNKDELRGIARMADGRVLSVGTTENFGNGQTDILLVTTDTLQAYSTVNESNFLDVTSPAITSVTSFDQENAVSVTYFPNPAQEAITFEMKDSAPAWFTLYDLQGNQVQRFRPSTKTWQVLRGSLASGVYLFRIEDTSGAHQMGRLHFH